MFLLFVILIAFVHGVSEALEVNFSSTRFASLNQAFWNPAVSRLKAGKLLGFRKDAETLAGVVMAFLSLLGFVLIQYPFFQINGLHFFWKLLLALFIYVASYNATQHYYVYRKPKIKSDEKTDSLP